MLKYEEIARLWKRALKEQRMLTLYTKIKEDKQERSIVPIIHFI